MYHRLAYKNQAYQVPHEMGDLYVFEAWASETAGFTTPGARLYTLPPLYTDPIQTHYLGGDNTAGGKQVDLELRKW